MTSPAYEIDRNPGSFDSFTANLGIDGTHPDALRLHSDALAEYRQYLADQLGISTDELHLRQIGDRALTSIES